MKHKLWLIKKLYIVSVRLMGYYSFVAQILFEGIYELFLLCNDDL